jgi:hypothetical protein
MKTKGRKCRRKWKRKRHKKFVVFGLWFVVGGFSSFETVCFIAENSIKIYLCHSDMKKGLLILLVIILFFVSVESFAQCSICTKTAQQMGEQPAKGMNSGILYLAFTPFAIVGYIGYRWWKGNKTP